MNQELIKKQIGLALFDRYPVWKRRIAVLLIGPMVVISSSFLAFGTHGGSTDSLDVDGPITASSVDAGGAPAVYAFQVTNTARAGNISISFSPCSTSGFECALTDGLGNVLTANPGVTVTIHFPADTAQDFRLMVTATSSAAYGSVDVTTVSVERLEDPFLSDSQDFTTTVNLGLPVALSKSVDSTAAQVGDQLTYTIDFQNDNAQTALSVEITDVVDSNLSSIATTGTVSGNTITWSIGDLPSGASGSVTFTATVGIVSDGQVILNSATSDGPNVEPGQSNSVAVTISAPVLSLSKEVSRTNALPGDTLSYTVTATNTGSSSLSGFVITDDVDVNLTVQSIGQGGSLAGSQISWSLPDLPSSASDVVTFTASINSNVPDGAVISNTAVGDGSEINPIQSNNVATTIDSRANMSISKVALTDPVVAGSNFTYRFVVTNSGLADAQDVSVLDLLPAGVSFVSSPVCAMSGPAAFECNLGMVASGSSTAFDVVVSVDSSIPTGTVLANSAQVTTTTSDSDPSNNSATAVVTVVEMTELTLSKSDGVSLVTAGSTATFAYTITVTNTGPSDATSVTLQDDWPVDFTRGALPPGCLDGGSGDFVCSIPSLAAGTSTSLVVEFTVGPSVSPGTKTNQVFITSVHPGDSSSGNLATDDTTVSQSADVAVFKTSSPNPVVAGGLLTYFVTVTSIGPSDASDVVFTDTLDTRTTFVSVSNGNCVHASGIVSCSFGTLVPGQALSFEIVVLVDKLSDGSVLANNAEVTASTSDPLLSNNSSVALTTVAAPSFLLVKSASPVSGSTVSPGQPIVYTITFTNSGSGDARGFVVTDTVSSLLGLLQINNGGTFDSATRTITWVVGLVPAGATSSVSFRAAPGVVSTATDLLNRASAISDEMPARILSNQTTHRVTPPQLSITKSADIAENSEVRALQSVTYRLTISNRLSTEVFGVVVTDAPPDGMHYVQGSTQVNGVPVADSGGSWFTRGLCLTPGSGAACDGGLPANATRVVSFQMTVDRTVRAGAILENWGYVIAIGHPQSGDFFDLRVLTPRVGPLLRQSILVQSASGETIFITVFNGVLAFLPVTGSELVLLVLLSLGSLGAGGNLSRRRRLEIETEGESHGS